MSVTFLLIIALVYTMAVVYWHEGDIESVDSLYYSFCGTSGVLPVLWRRDKIYHRDLVSVSWKYASELYRNVNLYGSYERDLIPPELDHILLGILDGLLCRNTILYRPDQQGKNYKEYSTWRLCVVISWNILIIYDSWQLRYGTAV